MPARILLFLILLFAALPFGSARPIWQWLWTILIALTMGLTAFSLRSRAHALYGETRFYFCDLPSFKTIVRLSLALVALLFALALFIPTNIPSIGVTIPTPSGKGFATATFFAEHLALFLLALAATPKTRQVVVFFKAVMIIATLYSVYGIAEHLVDGQHVLWFKKTSGWGSLTATFINRNNYATFAGLGLLCTTAVMFNDLARLAKSHTTNESRLKFLIEDVFRSQLWLYFLCFVLLATSLLLSGSRAGTLVTLLGLGFLTFFSFPDENRRLLRVCLAAIALTLIAGIALSGDFLIDRFTTESELGSRTSIYFLIVKNWTSGYIFGAGIGQFDDLFALYRSEELSMPIRRAHNDFLELLYTTGLGPISLLIVLKLKLVKILYAKISKGSKNRPFLGLGLASIVLVGTHSLVDFPLQIPAVSFLYVIILGLAYSLCREVQHLPQIKE